MSDDPTVLKLVDQVQADVQRLVRAEIALAKSQAVAAGKRAGVGIGAIVAGLVLLLPVVIALVMCIGFAFAQAGLDLWLAFLCTMGVFLAVIAALVGFGVLQLKKIQKPQKPDVAADVAALKPTPKPAADAAEPAIVLPA